MHCFLQWVGFDPDCKRWLVDEMTMLAQYKRKMGDTAVSIFHQAVNQYLEMFMEAQAQITAAIYVLCEAIV